jgi:hypothetical protein
MVRLVIEADPVNLLKIATFLALLGILLLLAPTLLYPRDYVQPTNGFCVRNSSSARFRSDSKLSSW